MSVQFAQAQTSTRRQRLPDFLVIGAAKSGTTTLYEDLRRHPGIFLPEIKETNTLLEDDVSRSPSRHRRNRAYDKMFAPAEPQQLCGEISPRYTTLPIVKGVPERARRLIGDKLKLIFIVRDPVQRVLSHYRFFYQRGYLPGNINEVIHQNGWLIDFSCYAMQIEPWLEAFGRDSLHVVLFENYIHERHHELDRICDFLKVPQYDARIDFGAIHNRTDGARVLRGFWRRMACSSVYLDIVRPMVSSPGTQSQFRWLRHWLAQGPLPDPPSATEETIRFITNAVRDDAQRFSELTGMDISSWESLER